MVIRARGVKDPEDAWIDFRRRIWAFWFLVGQGWDLPPDALKDVKTLDEHLFADGWGDDFASARNHFMKSFDSSPGYREPGSKHAFSWVKGDESRRFFAWAIPYWRLKLGYDTPLYENQYLPEREKLIFWLDVIHGTTGYKEDLESRIKNVWSQNKRIDKYLPVLDKSNGKKILHFWEKTKLKLEGNDGYSLAAIGHPGFDDPVNLEEYWYSSVLIYDLSSLPFEAKKDIIQSISTQWRNNNRTKKQKNLGLSLDAQNKLKEMASIKGIGEGELVESLIWQEAKNLSPD